MSNIIYFGCPYSHKDPEVVQERFEKACRTVAKLTSQGYVVISPIIYGHTLIQYHEMPGDWAFWKNFCQSFLVKCSEMMVYKMEGWEESEGLKAEIERADQLGLKITYVE
jgi:hypothetical protein